MREPPSFLLMMADDDGEMESADVNLFLDF
jgi:hypothetical protein